MPLSDQLKRLIAANAPLWAGEAEIARTYWTAPIRTIETDKKWLNASAGRNMSASPWARAARSRRTGSPA